MHTTPSSRTTLVLALLSALAPLSASAANLVWDSSGIGGATPVGGGGAWNTSNTNWVNASTNVSWDNVSGHNASFTTGAGGSIVLGENIVVNNLTFGGSSAYNISGAFTLTVNGTISGTRSNTVSSVITGTNGLTKDGNFTLGLLAAATYSGPTLIAGGILQPRTTNALPVGTVVTIGSTSAAATLDVRANQTLAGIAKGGTGTSTITQAQTVGTTTLTISSSATDSSYSGTITDAAGTGRLLALTKSGSSTLTLTGTNSYAGATLVSGGTLKLGSALSSTASVTVSGGTLAGDDLATDLALGLGAVSLTGTGAIAPGGVGTLGSFSLASAQNFSSATGTTLRFDLGATSDRINGSGGGLFSISGTTLSLNLLSGFDYSNDYALFSGFGPGSTVTGLTINGYDDVAWTAALGADGVLSFTSNIPEPSSFALLAGGLALASVSLRRRRARA